MQYQVQWNKIKIKPGLAYYSKYDQIIVFENCDRSSSHIHLLFSRSAVSVNSGSNSLAYFFYEEFSIFNRFETPHSWNCRNNAEMWVESSAHHLRYGLQNQKLFSTELGVTEDKPYFFASGKKISALYDSHPFWNASGIIFLSTRCSSLQLRLPPWVILSHCTILMLFTSLCCSEINKRTCSKFLNKMSVTKTARIFSHHVASMLCYMSSLRTDLQQKANLSTGSIITAEFWATVNGIFDSVNSRNCMLRSPLWCAVIKAYCAFEKMGSIPFFSQDNQIRHWRKTHQLPLFERMADYFLMFSVDGSGTSQPDTICSDQQI